MTPEQLDRLIFFTTSGALPPREWLAELFAARSLTASDRMALLIGRQPGVAPETGPAVCACRGVRAGRIEAALLYDALVADEVVALAPAACVKIRTGKRAGRASMAQETINRLMLRLARRGLRVVRLKGGDPSIFGRVGEEAAFLARHGVETEVIPGVTAASAAAAQFGFPLTHRGAARRLLISTATIQDGGAPGEGWAAAADPGATLALYMGRDQIAAAVAQLIAHGRSPDTRAMAVENAGYPWARALPATLAGLPHAMLASELDGPVVVIIGDVTARAASSIASAQAADRQVAGSRR